MWHRRRSLRLRRQEIVSNLREGKTARQDSKARQRVLVKTLITTDFDKPILFVLIAPSIAIEVEAVSKPYVKRNQGLRNDIGAYRAPGTALRQVVELCSYSTSLEPLLLLRSVPDSNQGYPKFYQSGLSDPQLNGFEKTRVSRACRTPRR